MTSYERVEKVIRYIERHRAEQPALAELAAVAGLSEHHFHRLFSRWAGTTPKAFLKYLTSAHAKSLLDESRDLLGASLEAGLSGPGRLHDLLVSVEGVSPGEYKARGAGVEIRYGFHDTPFGPALIGVTARGLCHFAFLEGQGRDRALRELKKKWPEARLRRDQAAASSSLASIFKKKPGGRLALVLKGTPFQIKVWEALLRIPPGRAASYADVARAVGRPRATRAVGSAVGRNALAYVIPCHRVLRSTGALGGYRWGPARKRAMLAWESLREEPSSAPRAKGGPSERGDSRELRRARV